MWSPGTHPVARDHPYMDRMRTHLLDCSSSHTRPLPIPRKRQGGAAVNRRPSDQARCWLGFSQTVCCPDVPRYCQICGWNTSGRLINPEFTFHPDAGCPIKLGWRDPTYPSNVPFLLPYPPPPLTSQKVQPRCTCHFRVSMAESSQWGCRLQTRGSASRQDPLATPWAPVSCPPLPLTHGFLSMSRYN